MDEMAHVDDSRVILGGGVDERTKTLVTHPHITAQHLVDTFGLSPEPLFEVCVPDLREERSVVCRLLCQDDTGVKLKIPERVSAGNAASILRVSGR